MLTTRLGVLFTVSGDYGVLGRDCRDGALAAVEDLQEEGVIAIEPVLGDPAGASERYVELARQMTQTGGCRHVIGTVTSQARKDVIPVMEKQDAQLWYVCPYEGFEVNPNVIYTGACPNQHLLPLFDHMLPTYGRRVFLAGANYVWGWEMNRLAREIVTDAGGEIVGERCLPIGETDVRRLVAEVEARRPDFILSNMLGPSNHAFLRAMRDLARRDGAFAPALCPVVSCDLTECELPEIGAGVADGQLAAASYFHSLDTPANRALIARMAIRFGGERRLSSYFVTSYASVGLFAEAVVRCGSDDPAAVKAALAGVESMSALGPLRIDAATNHASLPFLLGRIAGEDFEILQSRPAVAADPYLTWRRAAVRSPAARPSLRIVS